MNQHDMHEPRTKKTPPKGNQLYIGFKLNEMSFAVDILAVHEIISSTELTTIPNCPEYVEGLMKLRGNYFPLIDLHRLFSVTDRQADTEHSWIIILKNMGKLTGIRINEVTGVLDIDHEIINRSVTSDSAVIDPRYIAGICSIGEETIIIPDLAGILSGTSD